ncbi:hypothetical protein B0F90DRAFT_393962 [Multifurca ochricompacta]|uniref:Secreted protein n=1 Tax=Multifurca ochricompacta TaxID=376703 RepID=A0AAD4M4Z7_9AGAM|nr:hypothetical protein B0F90DRAFT_393962 [Multifurca ochricompacta]
MFVFVFVFVFRFASFSFTPLRLAHVSSVGVTDPYGLIHCPRGTTQSHCKLSLILYRSRVFCAHVCGVSGASLFENKGDRRGRADQRAHGLNGLHYHKRTS